MNKNYGYGKRVTADVDLENTNVKQKIILFTLIADIILGILFLFLGFREYYGLSTIGYIGVYMLLLVPGWLMFAIRSTMSVEVKNKPFMTILTLVFCSLSVISVTILALSSHAHNKETYFINAFSITGFLIFLSIGIGLIILYSHDRKILKVYTLPVQARIVDVDDYSNDIDSITELREKQYMYQPTFQYTINSITYTTKIDESYGNLNYQFKKDMLMTIYVNQHNPQDIRINPKPRSMFLVMGICFVIFSPIFLIGLFIGAQL